MTEAFNKLAVIKQKTNAINKEVANKVKDLLMKCDTLKLTNPLGWAIGTTNTFRRERDWTSSDAVAFEDQIDEIGKMTAAFNNEVTKTLDTCGAESAMIANIKQKTNAFNKEVANKVHWLGRKAMGIQVANNTGNDFFVDDYRGDSGWNASQLTAFENQLEEIRDMTKAFNNEVTQIVDTFRGY